MSVKLRIILLRTMIPPFRFLWVFTTSLYIKSVIRWPFLKATKILQQYTKLYILTFSLQLLSIDTIDKQTD